MTHCIFIFVLLPFFSKKQLKKLIKFMIEHFSRINQRLSRAADVFCLFSMGI